MTAPPEERKPKDPATWIGATSDRVASLSEYFLAGAERYTPEALRQAASESGFSPEEVDEAFGRATRRRRGDELAAPIRRRARWVVLAAYGLVYGVLALVFRGYDDRYGFATISFAVLTVVLGAALLISFSWIRGRRASAEHLQAAIVTMLWLPLFMLVSLAGLCVSMTRNNF